MSAPSRWASPARSASTAWCTTLRFTGPSSSWTPFSTGPSANGYERLSRFRISTVSFFALRSTMTKWSSLAGRISSVARRSPSNSMSTARSPKAQPWSIRPQREGVVISPW